MGINFYLKKYIYCRRDSPGGPGDFPGGPRDFPGGLGDSPGGPGDFPGGPGDFVLSLLKTRVQSLVRQQDPTNRGAWPKKKKKRNALKFDLSWDFPGGPWVKTPHFQCRFVS